jgi:uncharacterized repeat protein (TIGR01451 family)
VKVTAGTPNGTIISNTATVTSATRDTVTADNSATVKIAVAGGTQADLSVTNVGTPNPVAAGANITYTQTVTNIGPSDATSVTFTETIPANTTPQTITAPAGWVCSNPGATGTVVCTIADLPPATPAVFTIVVKVNNGVANGTVITDTASVSAATSDPNGGNNSAASTVAVGKSNYSRFA